MITSKSTVFFSHQELFTLPKKKGGWSLITPVHLWRCVQLGPSLHCRGWLGWLHEGALNSTDVEDPQELSDVSFLSRDRWRHGLEYHAMEATVYNMVPHIFFIYHIDIWNNSMIHNLLVWSVAAIFLGIHGWLCWFITTFWYIGLSSHRSGCRTSHWKIHRRGRPN